jgi:adenine-specific DNA-methyltransferase
VTWFLDPTCGSGTTASVVAEQWGRRWITIDTSRIALNIAKQRLNDGSVSLTTNLYDKQGEMMLDKVLFTKLFRTYNT